MKSSVERLSKVFTTSSRQKVFNNIEVDEDGVKAMTGSKVMKVASFCRISQKDDVFKIEYSNGAMYTSISEQFESSKNYSACVKFASLAKIVLTYDISDIKVTKANVILSTENGDKFKLKISDEMNVYYSYNRPEKFTCSALGMDLIEFMSARFCVGKMGRGAEIGSGNPVLDNLALYYENESLTGSVGVAGGGFAAANIGEISENYYLIPKPYCETISKIVSENKTCNIGQSAGRLFIEQDNVVVLIPMGSGKYPDAALLFSVSDHQFMFSCPRLEFVRHIKKCGLSFEKVEMNSDVMIASRDGENHLVSIGDVGDVHVEITGSSEGQTDILCHMSLGLVASIVNGIHTDDLEFRCAKQGDNSKILSIISDDYLFLIMPRSLNTGYNESCLKIISEE